jgi:uncharacterized protein with PIN domain
MRIINMVKVEEKYDLSPVCPHCNQPIEKIFAKQLSGLLGRRYIYFCSLCSKVLGISHRKGFFMG